MPLLKGNTRDIISLNIKELRKSGYPENQATAIALKTARKGTGKTAVKKVVSAKANQPYGSK